MDDLEMGNIHEIEGLNQRGGRTLSFVDLVEAGTLSRELAGFLLAAVRTGASFVTGAQPGGAGKSTVLATLLGFLHPGERIVSVDSRATLRKALRSHESPGECFLAHEIGSGPYYGYIWGRDVLDWCSLHSRGLRIASCIHADTYEEMHATLTSPPLGVPPAGVAALRLCLFLRVQSSSFKMIRRVAAVHWAPEPGRVPEVVYAWDPEADVIRQVGEPGLREADLEKAQRAVDSLLRADECDFRKVRQALLSVIDG